MTVTSSDDLFCREVQQYSTGLKFYMSLWILTAIDGQQVSVVNQAVIAFHCDSVKEWCNSPAFISIEGFHLYLNAWSLPECGLNIAIPSPDACAVSEWGTFGDLTLFESADKRSSEKCQTYRNERQVLRSISVTADKYLGQSSMKDISVASPAL